MKHIDPNIETFAEAAEKYCAWAESTTAGEPEAEMRTAELLLADLHAAIIRLTDIGCGEETTDEVSSEKWKLVRDRFQWMPVNGYWDVFDPLKVDSPVYKLLSDDLADIYRDVKEGLLIYKRGSIVEAVWEWRFTFSTHWGAHLIGSQRAIHSYLSNYS